MQLSTKKPLVVTIINLFYLALLNVLLMFVTGYLTFSHSANWNSRLGAVLLSFFIPYFIVSKTRAMGGVERMLKFGLGYIVYIPLMLCVMPFPQTILTGGVPCMLLSIGLLYAGNELFRDRISL